MPSLPCCLSCGLSLTSPSAKEALEARGKVPSCHAGEAEAAGGFSPGPTSLSTWFQILVMSSVGAKGNLLFLPLHFNCRHGISWLFEMAVKLAGVNYPKPL